jgi:hypothetical protein
MSATETKIRHTPELLEAARAIAEELDQFQCHCSASERLSGHRTDCRMPWVADALEKLNTAIAKAEG